ncbi:magnesium-dependent phosphatase [Nitzschia inconspicua]|uniref:Magnesium-dependent phosphatase n=1 Tax=Nitzschia inconspicua TaxID=303405 RepID=A0A9K3KY17_9STRA|nr:magnesium-dependent phosphatase [Nitzschia inconspicua]
MSSSSYSRSGSSTSASGVSVKSSPDDQTRINDADGSGRSIRLAVFDLDYTIWQPEMYQLYGNPRLVKAEGHKLSAIEKHETRTTEEDKIITDKSGTPIRVFSGASYALADIHRLREEGYEIQAAVASRTDEPDWAFFCMRHLAVKVQGRKGGNAQELITLLDCFGSGSMKKNPLIQISYQDKTHHFKRLHQATGIPYEDMVFFDNENWNIRSVSKLGVKCIYTPDGMQKKHWDQAKKAFGMECA